MAGCQVVDSTTPRDAYLTACLSKRTCLSLRFFVSEGYGAELACMQEVSSPVDQPVTWIPRDCDGTYGEGGMGILDLCCTRQSGAA